MNPKTTDRRWYFGFASFDGFLNNDPHYREGTKWNRRLIRAGIKCRPFSVREYGGLYVVHDTEDELLVTRMALDLTPRHQLPHPCERLTALSRHNIWAYAKPDIEGLEDINTEVLERLAGLIFFRANADDLPLALEALQVLAYAPANLKGRWLEWDLSGGLLR